MNKKDLARFDRLVSLMDSSHQMDRIKGRLAWQEWSAKFTKEELDKAWEQIKNRGKADG